MPQTICLIACTLLILTAHGLTYRKVKGFDVDEFILGWRVGEKHAKPDDVIDAYRLGRKQGAEESDVEFSSPDERPTVIPLPDQGTAWERHDDPEMQ